MLKHVAFYYFSPTGGTKRAGELFCQEIAEDVQAFSLSHPLKEKDTDSELTVFAVPVFGGRVPEVAMERIKSLNGSGKKAVTLVAYGVRAYEDALLEVNDKVKAQGYQIAASMALVAQHSMAPEVGKGRPDDKDAKEICAFAKKVEAKLAAGTLEEIKVPGNRPYKEGMKAPATPITISTCKSCGTCAKVCPTEAIHMEDGTVVTKPEKCILCMACVAACPEQSRMLPPPLKEMMEQKLGALKDVRRENEFFL